MTSGLLQWTSKLFSVFKPWKRWGVNTYVMALKDYSVAMPRFIMSEAADAVWRFSDANLSKLFKMISL